MYTEFQKGEVVFKDAYCIYRRTEQLFIGPLSLARKKYLSILG